MSGRREKTTARGWTGILRAVLEITAKPAHTGIENKWYIAHAGEVLCRHKERSVKNRDGCGAQARQRQIFKQFQAGDRPGHKKR